MNRLLTLSAFSGERLCNGTVSVRLYAPSVNSSSDLQLLWLQPVAAPEGRSRVGFSLCEAAERRRREERGAEGSRRCKRRDERRRREGRGATGAEG